MESPNVRNGKSSYGSTGDFREMLRLERHRI